MPSLLVIDDDQSICRTLDLYFSRKGMQVDTALSGRQGLELFATGRYSVVVLDLRLSDLNGLEVLDQIRAGQSPVPVIVITAYHDMPTTVGAMKRGAFDYIHKPIDIDELDAAVGRALEASELMQRKDGFLTVGGDLKLEDIVGKSKEMVAIFKTIGLVAGSKTTVLIEGESGTGKELIAQAIHEFSDPVQPFIAVNCSALVETLLESELFGHERGAFTGAAYRKEGKFALAHGGTLFLDEIGDMPASMQIKLLRVMQERSFERVGGKDKISVDVRIIAATHRDLDEMVNGGRFREDLYYRLKVVHIKVPPLRRRPEDIPLLIKHLVGKINREFDRSVSRIPKELMDRLVAYPWPGNVRELENYLRRAIVISPQSVLREQDFVQYEARALRMPVSTPTAPAPSAPDAAPVSLDTVEREHIERVLRTTKGNKSEACRILGISHPTLDRKIKKYGLAGPRA